ELAGAGPRRQDHRVAGGSPRTDDPRGAAGRDLGRRGRRARRALRGAVPGPGGRMSDARKRQEPGPPARLARRLIPMLALLAMGCRAEAPEHGPWTEVADSASTRRLVESPALCTDCVRLDEVVAIGNAEGPGILVSNTLGFRDRAGNYWIGQDGPIRVFDPGGRFVRDVGRRGEGPMEFRFPL